MLTQLSDSLISQNIYTHRKYTHIDLSFLLELCDRIKSVINIVFPYQMTTQWLHTLHTQKCYCLCTMPTPTHQNTTEQRNIKLPMWSLYRPDLQLVKLYQDSLPHAPPNTITTPSSHRPTLLPSPIITLLAPPHHLPPCTTTPTTPAPPPYSHPHTTSYTTTTTSVTLQ